MKNNNEISMADLVSMIHTTEQEILLLKRTIASKRKKIRAWNKTIQANVRDMFNTPNKPTPQLVSVDDFGYSPSDTVQDTIRKISAVGDL